MAERSTQEIIAIELANLCQVLEDKVSSVEDFSVWLAELGWDLGALPSADAIQLLAGIVAEIIDLLSQLDDEADIDETAVIIDLLEKSNNLLSLVKDVSNIFHGASLPQNFIDNAPGQMVKDLFISYLDTYHRLIYALFRLFGVIQEVHQPANSNRLEYTDRNVDLSSLGEFLKNPSYTFEQHFKWGKDDFDFALLLEFLEKIIFAVGIPSHQQLPDSETLGTLYKGRDQDQVDEIRDLRIPFYESFDEDSGYATVGISLLPMLSQNLNNGRHPEEGIVLSPYTAGNVEFEIPLGGAYVMRLSGNVAGSVQIKITKDGANIENPMKGGASLSGEAGIEFGLLDKGAPKIILGEKDGSRLQINDLGIKFGTIVTIKNTDAFIEFKVEGGRIIVASSKGDGFIQKALSNINLDSEFDLLVGWSSIDGVYFRGSAGLEITLPIHKQIGPVVLDTVFVGIAYEHGSGQFEVKLSVSAGIKIGPVSVSVEKIGLRSLINMDDDGNLGPINIGTPIFLPPTGAGFSISQYGLVGGGTLVNDDVNKRYSGTLSLNFGDVGITAIGFVDTRSPDGSESYSLVINMGITFPVQISMGFTLSGLGGLIAVNRTMDTEVIRNGIRTGLLDSILFPNPDTIVENSGKIISDLRSAFPPREGRFIIGPMLKIGWGTPNIITGEVGIFIELFDPIRIVLLGQMEMALPEPDDAIVKVNIQIVGVLDFEKKELSFQASIDASSILVFELFGDIAFLIGWGSQPQFGMALGGFHPKFTPPAPASIFSNLRRLTVNVNYGPVVQLQCTGFLAITPNSLQFGAKISVFIGISDIDLGVYGFIGFDALFIFSPFSFEVGIQAGLSVRVMGVTLAEVYVSFRLSGPTPWNVSGNARVKIIFFDIDVSFSVTWGRYNANLLDPVDPWPSLLEDFQRAESWGSSLPSSASLVESLRNMRDEPVIDEEGEPLSVPVVVHPAGCLEVRQNIAPLEVTLSKFGNAPVHNYNRFRIDQVTTHDKDILLIEPVKEFFSRGQFEYLSAEQKLSIPSFEKMQAGVSARSSRISIQGERVYTHVGYESILINSDLTSKPAPNSSAAVSKWSQARVLCNGNASSRSALRSQGRVKFAQGNEGLIGTMEEKYVIVDANTLKKAELDTRVDMPQESMTRTQADQVLAQHLALHPDKKGELLVIAEYEMEVAA